MSRSATTTTTTTGTTSATVSGDAAGITEARATSTASVPRTIVLLLAAFAVAGTANSIVAFAAIAAGASSTFTPLSTPVFLAFTALGVAGGYLGWRIVRRVFRRPARVLRVLVPVALLLSWVPDVALAVLQFIPGTTTVGAVGLALMHAVVVAVVVPVYARIAPVS